jgi:hypothetical protein
MKLLISSIILIFSFITFIYVIDKLKNVFDDLIALFLLSLVISTSLLLCVLKIITLDVSQYNIPTLNPKYYFSFLSIGIIYLHIKKFKMKSFKQHIIFFILFSLLSIYFNLNFGIIYFTLNVILPIYLNYKLNKLDDKLDYVIYKNALNVILNVVSILLIICFNINLYL